MIMAYLPQKDRTLSSQEIIATDDHGRSWLFRDLLEVHDEHIVFTDSDGTRRLDVVASFYVFEWKGELWEVQGYDRKQRRWWIEPVGGEIPVTDHRRVGGAALQEGLRR